MFNRLCLKLCNRVQKDASILHSFQPTVDTVLVIVESPNKIKLIESNLQPVIENIQKSQKRVKVMATIGHFMEMLDVKLNASFGVKWQLAPEKQKTIEGIRNAIHHPLISEVVLASDPDREGELIAAHIHDALFPKKNCPPFSRAYFYAMTKEMIIQGFQNRQKGFIDKNLVESALARHIIDRMFGFIASTHLMLHHSSCRSIGRVQTPALNLIENRERSIQEYEKRGVTYTYSTEPAFSLKQKDGPAREFKGTFCGDYDVVYDNEAECNNIISTMLKGLDGRSPDSISIKESTKSRSPPPPLTMAMLIDAASRILRLKGETVTAIAQSLFTMGLITYPRSDSERLCEDFEKSLAAYVKENYGQSMVYTGRKIRKRSSNAEGAHEAIRPTDLSKLPSKIQVEEGNPRALYALIHDHTIASRMQPIVTKIVTITMEFKSSPKIIQSKIAQSYVHDFGYLKALDGSIIQSKQTNDQEEAKKKYNDLLSMPPQSIVALPVKVARHSDTKPSRFTEGTLITALKDAGIGRPSTYAATLQKLNERGYTKYFDGKGKLAIGPNGNTASRFAKDNYQTFVRMDFTGSMETDLNDIANGDKGRIDVVQTFWKQLKSCLSKNSCVEASTIQEFTMQFRQRYGKRPGMGNEASACRIPNQGEQTKHVETSENTQNNEKKKMGKRKQLKNVDKEPKGEVVHTRT